MEKDELANQQSTEVTLTADGAIITMNLNIVMMRLKEMEAL